MLVILFIALIATDATAVTEDATSKTIHYHGYKPFRLEAFNPDKCYEVDVHITTYCNSVNVTWPTSKLVQLSGTYRHEYQHRLDNSQSNSRETTYKTTIYIYNGTHTNEVIIERGSGCPDGILDIHIHRFKVYEKACPSIPHPLTIFTIFIGFVILFVLMVKMICEELCCNCRRYN